MVIGPHAVQDLGALLELEAIKPDAYLGVGPEMGWGRIYGGQVVAQALRAASLTIDVLHRPHSLHAYFIRSGDEKRPVLYEVERVRDGRSFTTRQVVAYQQGGAILNLIASFEADEDEPDVQAVTMPTVPDPETLTPLPPEGFIDRRDIERTKEPSVHGLTWLRTLHSLPDDPVLQACGFAYISDDHALGVALYAHPLGVDWEKLMTASLDHAIWFHRPFRADDWLLFDLDGHGVANGRGLSFGRVFDRAGRHVASIAQEALGRVRR